MKKLKNIILKFGLVCFIGIILALSVRGIYGNPDGNALNTTEFKEKGPFELSPERGRFALTYSLVEDKSFYFSVPLARFTTPDLGYKNGHYVSLFAPGVSFLVMPGYIIGKYFGISQVGTFAFIALFGAFNFFLIIAISQLLGLRKAAGVIAGIVFLFATPAFPYAVTLYQHHISTFLILASLYLYLKYNNFLSNAAIWLLAALSIPVDYPNLFLMFPIALAALLRNITVGKSESSIKLGIRFKALLSIPVVLIPLAFFMWFNQKSYGNPLQFSGTIPSVKAIDENGKPDVPKGANIQDVERFVNPNIQKKSSLTFFKPRSMVNGLYIHLISVDRGIIVFTPIIIFGIAGIAFLAKRDKKTSALLAGIAGVNLILYSMWGDPWGGWAFGSRYLIPAYSVIAIGVGAFINNFQSFFKEKSLKNIIILTVFTLVLTYSLFVNTVGALTTSAIPPLVETGALEAVTHRKEYSNYVRGIELLSGNTSKSFVFSSLAGKYLSAWEYFSVIYGLLLIFSLVNLSKIIFKKTSVEESGEERRLKDGK